MVKVTKYDRKKKKEDMARYRAEIKSENTASLIICRIFSERFGKSTS